MQEMISDRILDLARQIQQIPSPTFSEAQKAGFIRDQFLAEGADDVTVDEIGNVYVHIAGNGEKPPLIISAHMDTVFPLGTDLACVRTSEKMTGPGIGDNSLGVAGLFGLYWHLCDGVSTGSCATQLAGDVWLVADVGEEGLGDLRGMKAVVERFGKDSTAYIVLEGMSLGQIYTRGLGVRRYRIQVDTKGGHSWIDYGKPSAIHELADLVVKIKNIDIPSEPRASLNVGVIHGGTTVNTIASQAYMELDLRSENVQALRQLCDQVEAMVREAVRDEGEAVLVRAEVIGDRPVGEIALDHPLVKAAIDCFERQSIKIKLNIGSTDANVPLSRGYPAICLGLTTGGGSHTLGEYIETKPLNKGFQILVDLVQACL